MRGGEHERAFETANTALVLEAEVIDKEIKAYALAGLGHAYALQKRFDEAFACLNESLELFPALDHIPGQSWTLSRLGTAALYSGDYAKAGARFFELTKRVRQSGKEQSAFLVNVPRCKRNNRRLFVREPYIATHKHGHHEPGVMKETSSA